MAIAVGHCHDLKPPAARGRHYRLHSVAQLDRACHQEPHSDDEDGAGSHTGLSPRRRTQSSPCFTTTVAPAGHADEAAAEKKMPLVEIVAGRNARGVRELIAEAAGAIVSGTRLVPAQSGLGGALLLNDGRSGERVAVIKPLEDGNPESGGGGGYATEAVLREVAAFLLDHDGFASVEQTALIRISRPAAPPTVASIQRFVAHEYDAGELGPSRFSVASVHRVAILDVRLLNIDRHAGNILVKKPPPSNDKDGTTRPPLFDLVPIDHGLCLPEQLDDPYFEWLHWPQASLAFSDAELAYVASLDPLKDAEMLRTELPSLKEPAIRILTLCTTFLKRAAAAGLCLADIGDMMTREASDGMSALETLCKECHDSVHPPLPFILPPSSDGDGVGVGATSSGEGRKHVSFGQLSAEEWAAFLDRFEQLLPAALEDKKRAGLKL